MEVVGTHRNGINQIGHKLVNQVRVFILVGGLLPREISPGQGAHQNCAPVVFRLEIGVEFAQPLCPGEFSPKGGREKDISIRGLPLAPRGIIQHHSGGGIMAPEEDRELRIVEFEGQDERLQIPPDPGFPVRDPPLAPRLAITADLNDLHQNGELFRELIGQGIEDDAGI